ncbi:type VII secretion-associated protein [Corynebacterium heidelbergense]|uniref:Type VII secretion-associated protein n=1 Tax=Corynebacterium heidelbergense TaxID=2055947 RepID=A0A364V790_9CORY|nr:type VII secretion-associated protein [Corynebacterium heidelbergense]RAV32507.1 type VII secretion-associated protein [Corynebacterium heidelbergense]
MMLSRRKGSAAVNAAPAKTRRGGAVEPLVPPLPPMGVVAQAVGLQESGLLVDGATVTDLSTGFVAVAELPESSPNKDPLLADEGEERFRRSPLGHARLDQLREAVIDALEQRVANPSAASAKPTLPRNRFPWGIGINPPDLLVLGPHAPVVAKYLQLEGFRARVYDPDPAIEVAHALARAEREAGVPPTLRASVGEPAVVAGPGAGLQAGPKAALGGGGVPTKMTPSPYELGHDAGAEDGGFHRAEEGEELADEDYPEAEPQRSPSPRRAAVPIVVGCGVLGVGIALAVMIGGAGDSESQVEAGAVNVEAGADDTSGPAASGTAPVAEGSPSSAPAATAATAPMPAEQRDAPEDPWRHAHGRADAGPANASSANSRARVPTTADVAGWRRAGATPEREEYRSGDEGMRVLVAAAPAPVHSQAELDRAVLTALGKTGDMEIVSNTPVSYRERFADSVTLWHVRFVAGHQVSVGCQYRNVTPERMAICDRFAATARPE